MIARLFPFGIVEHFIYHADNLIAGSGGVVPVGQFTEPEAATERLGIQAPFMDIAGIDAVHLLGDRQVGLALGPSGICVEDSERIGFLEHPIIDLGLRVVFRRRGQIGLRTRHIAEGIGSKHRRTEHNRTADKDGVELALFLCYLIHFTYVSANIIEMPTPHRMAVNAEELPALAIGIRTGLALRARSERLREIHAIFSMVVADLRSIEADRRNSLIHRSGDGLILTRIHIEEIFAAYQKQRGYESGKYQICLFHCIYSLFIYIRR